MSLYVWDSTNTKRQLLGTAVKVRQNDTWVDVSSIKVRNGGAWVNAWYASDPITLTFNATLVNTFRDGSWLTSDADYGNRATVGAYYLGTSQKDLVGTIGAFRDSSNNTLESVLNADERKIIKSATLYMQRTSPGIGNSSAYGTVYTCMYKGAVNSASPTYTKLEYGADYRASRVFGGGSDTLTKGEQWSMSVAAKTVEGLRDNGYSISLLSRITGVGTNKTTVDYMLSSMRGPSTPSQASSTGYKPTLVITIDYV